MNLDLSKAGNRLDTLIKESGKSIQSFAADFGVSRQTAHKWVKGQALTHQRILDLSQHFNVEPSWLLLGSGEKRQPGTPEYCETCELKMDVIERGIDNAEFVFEYNFKEARFIRYQRSDSKETTSLDFDLSEFLSRIPKDYAHIAERIKDIFENKTFTGVIYLPIKTGDGFRWFAFSKIGYCKGLFLLLSVNQVDVKDIDNLSL